MEAERLKVINHNYKIFQMDLKALLDKPDDEVFLESMDKNFLVKEAKSKQNLTHSLFASLAQKVLNLNLPRIDKVQFK